MSLKTAKKKNINQQVIVIVTITKVAKFRICIRLGTFIYNFFLLYT